MPKFSMVKGQGQKSEQKPTTKNFVGFHNHSPLLSMVTLTVIIIVNLRWLNRVMQDHEARASDLNRKLIFSFFLLFS